MIVNLRPVVLLLFSLIITGAPNLSADTADDINPLAALPMRHIGPALMSGRISDFAFYPGGNQAFIAGISSGNIFRTFGGTTWEPFSRMRTPMHWRIELDPNDTSRFGWHWRSAGSVAAGSGVINRRRR